ncbi:transposase [Paenibacillus sp. MBLB4367]|uniref:IS66 family transposase n=1 Tax=Paenibacillus sp. MBLB4367 TaxID=3384767 RepID=UPI0039083CC0
MWNCLSARKNSGALTVFAFQPHVPMDNNRAERLLRLVALGRKNYYGCHAQWSGEFTAVCLTIMQTAALHSLNIEAYMRYILDELALHPGEHPDIDSLLRVHSTFLGPTGNNSTAIIAITTQ